MDNYTTELRLLQQFLEGPTFLRAVSGFAGLGLAVGAVLITLGDIHTLSPAQLILRAYTTLFGLILAINECKTVDTPQLQAYQQWVFRWFPFLSVMAGKGMFMLLVGAVGMAYHDHYLVYVPATLLAAAGTMYMFVHYNKRQEMEQAIDKSMNLAAYSYYDTYSKYQRADAYPPTKQHDYAQGW